MNLVHIHLLLNHFPVIGLVLGVLLLVFAFLRRSNELKKVSLGIFVLLAILTIPVYFSGEPAEESVEHLPGVSESIIEQHEDAAGIALTGVIILGVLSLITLLLFRHRPQLPAWLAALSLVVALITTGLMAFTANLGGQVRHTEIRSDAAAAATVEDHAGKVEDD